MLIPEVDHIVLRPYHHSSTECLMRCLNCKTDIVLQFPIQLTPLCDTIKTFNDKHKSCVLDNFTPEVRESSIATEIKINVSYGQTQPLKKKES